MNVSRELAEELVREAARAPSVHNVQPARWRFPPGSQVWLFRDLRRDLPEADPHGHDVEVSLGSAYEGMSLALSRRGFGLSPPEPCPAPAEGPFAPVVRAYLRKDAAEDPLAPGLLRRRSWRGRFRRSTPAEVAGLCQAFAGAADVTFLTGRPVLARLARRHDEASYGFLASPAYQEELYGWMRFFKRSPAWRRDGLNGDCMALSAPERWAGAALLHPKVFPLMKKLGLGRLAVSEAAAVASAATLLLFHAPITQPPFEVGRRFHRLWLELEATGWHACPLSALADDRAAAAELHREAGLPADHRLINVLRVGKPARRVAESPRLPVAELLV